MYPKKTIFMSCPHRPYEGSQHDVLRVVVCVWVLIAPTRGRNPRCRVSRRHRSLVLIAPTRGRNTRTPKPPHGACAAVLIAPTRGRNEKTCSIRSSGAKSSSPLRGVATISLNLVTQKDPRSSSPLRGVATRRASTRLHVAWPRPHRPYEGSQLVAAFLQTSVPDPSSSPLRGVATLHRRGTTRARLAVLIAPTRGRNDAEPQIFDVEQVGPHRPYEGSQPRHA